MFSLEEGKEARATVHKSLWAAKELGKMTELSLQQEKGLLTIQGDQGHRLAGEVVRSLSLELCKLLCMSLCQKLFWDEQAKETHCFGMLEWWMAWVRGDSL